VVARQLAVKRLSAVEVNHEASHQHEFHAGVLRQRLGFREGRHAGRLRLAIYPSNDPQDVVFNEGRYTLYDAREAHPTRSEYRLYYDASLLSPAAAGDLLVLFREDDDTLTGVIARPGTGAARRLTSVLAWTGEEFPDSFRYMAAPAMAPATIRAVIHTLVAEPAPVLDYVDLAEEEIDAADRASRIPTTAVMARLAQAVAKRVHGPLGPDETLYHGLEAESDIYFEMEKRIQTRRLEELQARGSDLVGVTALIMAMLQSRKSRRGQSLQHHFAALLDGAGIVYTPQCKTEPGETPDFIMPSCDAYHDPAFPDERLRLVACKTTTRERWRQILSEGDRIASKYLLTVDRTIASDTVIAMRDVGLRIFLPAPIISSTYPDAAGLGTVSELLMDLHSAA